MKSIDIIFSNSAILKRFGFDIFSAVAFHVPRILGGYIGDQLEDDTSDREQTKTISNKDN